MKSLILLLLVVASIAQSQTTIVIWKQEMQLEIRSGNDIVSTFNICSLADRNFPKRKAGDMRTPEGEYRISFINRQSNSYKTIGVSYPNAEDRKRGYTGGGIGIHGKCCSSGCIGMTNEDMDSILEVLDRLHAKKSNCLVVILPSRDSNWIKRQMKAFPEYRQHYEALGPLLSKYR